MHGGQHLSKVRQRRSRTEPWGSMKLRSKLRRRERTSKNTEKGQTQRRGKRMSCFSFYFCLNVQESVLFWELFHHYNIISSFFEIFNADCFWSFLLFLALFLFLKVSRSVLSDFLRPHGLYIPWNSPGQDTGLGSLSVLQGMFPSQG